MSELTFRSVQQDSLGQRFRDALPPWPACVLIALGSLLIPALLLRYQMVWVIGGLVGLVGMALVIASPYLGLLIFLGLLYLRPEESFPALAGARMTLLVSLAAFVAWAINACLSRERFRFHLPVVGCFLGFLAVAIGSTTVNASGTLSDTTLELLKLLILFVLIVHLVNTQKRLQIMIGTLVLFSLILAVRTIWQYQSGQVMYVSAEYTRALSTGIFGDPNDLALALAMAMPLALGTIFGRAGAWTRFWNLLAVPVLVWTIFITNSRGGMLALGVALLTYFSRRLGRLGLILGAIAVVGLFAFGPSRLNKMNAQDESAQGRVYAWDAGMKMLNGSPIWGVGKGQFIEHHRRTAHNSLVLCLAEDGFLGTAFWLGLFYFAFRYTQKAGAFHARGGAEPGEKGTGKRFWKAASQSMAVQISLITFTVGGFFLSRTYTQPLYVYLGLAVAAAQVEWAPSGQDLPEAKAGDWVAIGALTVAGWVLIHLLIRLWS